MYRLKHADMYTRKDWFQVRERVAGRRMYRRRGEGCTGEGSGRGGGEGSREKQGRGCKEREGRMQGRTTYRRGGEGVTGGMRGGRGGRRSKSEGWSYLAPWASMKESKFFTAGSLNLRNLMTGGPSCKVSCSSSLLNNGKEPLLQEQEIRERGRRVW